MFIFNIFFLVIAIPGLLLVPTIYMNFAKSFIPDDLRGSLFGWRMFGLMGVIIGFAILMIRVDAL